jgi:hypothetical protein
VGAVSRVFVGELIGQRPNLVVVSAGFVCCSRVFGLSLRPQPSPRHSAATTHRWLRERLSDGWA